jgi:hypothetical protein
VHFREILSGYFLFSRFDWSIFVTQLVAKHMKEIILNKFTSPTLPNFINGFEYKIDFKFNFILLLTKTFLTARHTGTVAFLILTGIKKDLNFNK